MTHDHKQMVCSPARCRRGALLLALLAALLATPNASATMPQTLAWHRQSPQTGFLYPAAARSKQHASKTIMITNLRASQEGNRHRLVLDFAKPATFTHQRMSDPAMLIIDLKNVALSNAARRTAEDDKFPVEIAVTQASPKHVRVVLDMEDVSNLSLTKLSKPDRLVVDYVAHPATPAAGAQPKITLPPVSRQITLSERQARLDIETIVLDPGHGGIDPGTENKRVGVNEKTTTLDVALRAKKLLELRGWRVLLIRADDRELSKDKKTDLLLRDEFANKNKADLFLSIHFNSAPQAITGVETYTMAPQSMLSTGDETGDDMTKVAYPGNRFDHANLLFGERIHRAMRAALQTPDRGYKRGRHAVLRMLDCPGALVECAYLSNDAEARRVATPEFRQQIAQAIADGVQDYADTLAVLRPAPPPAEDVQ